MEKPTLTGPAGATPPTFGRRIAGIDLARALAIIGMVAVHVSPSGTGSRWAYVLAVPRGRAAILFALIAGVGVSLLTSSRSTSTSEARGTLLWRAVVLLPLGLYLQTLDHNVYVILADYAVLFVLAALILTWPDRVLLMLAGVSATIGSLAYLYGRIEAPAAFTRDAATWGAPWTDTLHALVLSGPYPLLTWTAPFCLGIWLGRRDLTAVAIRWRMVLAGGALALLVPLLSWGLVRVFVDAAVAPGWWQLLDDEPHSQMPLWLLSASAAAVAVLGLSLLAADRFPRATAPLVAAGRLAFTWYVLHVLVLHVQEAWLRTGSITGTFAVVAVFTVVMATASTLWLRAFRRGPLEFALQPPWRARSRRNAHEPVG
jgi:uncharacterized membrane protein YeiB